MTDRLEESVFARFQAIANPVDDSDWQDVLARTPSAETHASRERRRRRTWWLAGVSAIAVAVAVAALAWRGSNDRTAAKADASAIRAAHRHLQRTTGKRARSKRERSAASTKVGTLVAFRYRLNALQAAALPPSVAEVVSQMGADPNSGQRPISGPPAIYLFKRGASDLCMIVALAGHSSGTCYYVLAEAGGALVNPDDVIVSGKRFICGLVSNDVKAITVQPLVTGTTSPSGNPVTAIIRGNVFIASVPYEGGAVAAVTLTASRAGGLKGSLEIPGVPAPTP